MSISCSAKDLGDMAKDLLESVFPLERIHVITIIEMAIKLSMFGLARHDCQ